MLHSLKLGNSSQWIPTWGGSYSEVLTIIKHNQGICMSLSQFILAPCLSQERYFLSHKIGVHVISNSDYCSRTIWPYPLRLNKLHLILIVWVDCGIGYLNKNLTFTRLGNGLCNYFVFTIYIFDKLEGSFLRFYHIFIYFLISFNNYNYKKCYDSVLFLMIIWNHLFS